MLSFFISLHVLSKRFYEAFSFRYLTRMLLSYGKVCSITDYTKHNTIFCTQLSSQHMHMKVLHIFFCKRLYLPLLKCCLYTGTLTQFFGCGYRERLPGLLLYIRNKPECMSLDRISDTFTLLYSNTHLCYSRFYYKLLHTSQKSHFFLSHLEAISTRFFHAVNFCLRLNFSSPMDLYRYAFFSQDFLLKYLCLCQ